MKPRHKCLNTAIQSANQAHPCNLLHIFSKSSCPCPYSSPPPPPHFYRPTPNNLHSYVLHTQTISFHWNSCSEGAVGHLLSRRCRSDHATWTFGSQFSVWYGRSSNLIRQASTLLRLRRRCSRWFRSYLTGRSQCIRYNGVQSESVPVLYGEPQGSVLGPVLFILYSADVINIATKHGFLLIPTPTICRSMIILRRQPA